MKPIVQTTVKTIAASAFIASLSGVAQADQFIVQLDTELSGDDAMLRASLGVTEIDAFQHNGAHFVVLDAKTESVIEAFFYAKKLDPIAILSFPTSWASAGLHNLEMGEKLNILISIPCDYCI